MELQDNALFEMVKLWIATKETAIEENDYSLYRDTLKISLKELNRIYAKGEEEWFLDMVGELIKVGFVELGNLNLESKKSKLPF